MNNNLDKTRSTFQKKVNRIQKKMQKQIDGLSRSLKKEKTYHDYNEKFLKVLLADGRTTKEELSRYFPKIKK